MITEKDKKALQLLAGSNSILEDRLKLLKKENKKLKEQLNLCGVINWVAVSDKLPTRMDEYYLVVVKNKNKPSGIYLQDIGNFSSDGIWIKANTWEDVTHWRELPKPPCL